MSKESKTGSGTQTAAAVFFDTVARRILAAHPAPDLRNITVILPSNHVAKPLAQALVRVAEQPALLLPQMVTLNDWAQIIPLDSSVIADSKRSALLYQHLRRQPWFENADLWGMTQELLGLFDELTHSLHHLPADAESFAAEVQRAYQARQNAALQLEARLVFELWHAMQDGDELDTSRAYQQRLAKLAAQAERPLYVLRTSDWDVLEQRFLETYEQRAMVKVFDLREMERQVGIPHFFAATSLEQEARAASMQIRCWLAEGKRDIAIVAQDRVVARRVRALLERAEVLVADETGWTFATLSVSTVLDRWLTALQSDFYHGDLLDLLKSPFVFADMSASERKSVVYQLEQLLRQYSVVEGLEHFIILAENELSLHAPLARLRQAAALLEQNRKRTLSEWLAALQQSMDVLGINQGLHQDDAGQQLLRALETWRHELAQDSGRYGFREWRRWLAQQLDTQTYRDTGIESSVRFTHLAATRWRAFDAVLLLGCDADHLPSATDGGRWFNDAVRSALNLPTRAMHASRQRDDLHALLTLNSCVLVTWQQEQDGEQRLLSSYLQMLRDDLEQVSSSVLDAHKLHDLLMAEDAHTVDLPQAMQPAPGMDSGVVPQRISTSAYNSLVVCPYQFYARHILRLNELDEVQEVIEKRDYGERVHSILQRFHARYPRVSEHPRDEMEVGMRKISEEEFADLLAQDFTARAWLERWFKSLPAYLVWQAGGETAGWLYTEAEKDFVLELDGIQLRGRIDRLDVKEGEKRVLDYKTKDVQTLRNMLKEPGEEVQLACYAHAEGASEAAFVGIENGKVADAPAHNVAELARLNIERLENVMARIHAGAGMPANGIDAACQHCEMRGVCRKGEWL